MTTMRADSGEQPRRIMTATVRMMIMRNVFIPAVEPLPDLPAESWCAIISSYALVIPP